MSDQHISGPGASPDVLRFLRARRAHGPSWAPDGASIAYVADTSGLDQAWVVPAIGREPYQLTSFGERVGLVAWSPAGDRVLVTVDAGGNEHDQLYLVSVAERRTDAITLGGAEARRDAGPTEGTLDGGRGGETAGVGGGRVRALTNEPDVIHSFGAWSPDGDRIAYSCNRRHRAFFDVWVMDVATGEDRCVMQRDATLHVAAWSPDGAALLVSRENTNLDNDLFLVPLDGSEPRLLTAHTGEAAYTTPRFAPDGRTLYVATNRDREFAAPAALDLAATVPAGGHAPMRILSDTSWDASDLTVTRDGKMLAYALNEDGRSKLMFYDLAAGLDVVGPLLPEGVIEGLAWSPDNLRLAFSLNGTRHNGNIWVATAVGPEAEQVTFVPGATDDPARLIAPEVVHYTSFDGLAIPAYYYLPTDRSRERDGTLPVIVFVHGGPESQFHPLHAAPWMPPLQYYLSRGFAVFAPNVRGSSGYGKTYIHLDDVRLRPNSVADLEAGVRWLVSEGGADPRRIGIMGRSYGGFMVLAAVTTYPDLWAAAVDMVGIANFLTFFENTGVWRRHLRTPEYGDPATDADFLRELSPLFKADRITAPLLVLHGENDPRVPVGEARQIVAAVRQNGRPAELLTFADEGHFMLRESTQLRAYTTIGDWFERYMG